VKLKRRFETAPSDAEKAAVLDKLSKVAPSVVEEWRQRLQPTPPTEERVTRRKAKPAAGDA